MLKKINWKFRKTHISLTLLTIFINDKWNGWGFDILNISHNLWEGSFLKMMWTLPNGAEKKFSFSGDLLFLRQRLLSELSDIDDRMLWSRSISKWDEFKFWALRLIFK
jgi:hypothetical protein